MSISEVKVPDIGDFQDVEVVEVICKEGQSVAVEDPRSRLKAIRQPWMSPHLWLAEF